MEGPALKDSVETSGVTLFLAAVLLSASQQAVQVPHCT